MIRFVMLKKISFCALLIVIAGCHSFNENPHDDSTLQKLMRDKFPPVTVEIEYSTETGHCWRATDLETGKRLISELIESPDIRSELRKNNTFAELSPPILPYRWRIRYTFEAGLQIRVEIDSDACTALVSSHDPDLIELRDTIGSSETIRELCEDLRKKQRDESE